MTISEIIENIETQIENIEEMTQLPEEEKRNVLITLNDVNENLSHMADIYGEDASDNSDYSDSIDEDN